MSFAFLSDFLRNSEEKLYVVCLDACIQGLENFPVDKRQRSSERDFLLGAADDVNNNSANSNPNTCRTSPQPVPLPSSVAMSRQPPRIALPFFSNQDARSGQASNSNFAVQPAVGAGNLKLKKNAVKIVSTRAVESSEIAKIITNTASVTAPVHTPEKAKIELTSANDRAESALDALFARLHTKTSATTPTTKKSSATGPGSEFTFEARPQSGDVKILKSSLGSLPTSTKDASASKHEASSNVKRWADMSQEELGQEYVQKATDYLTTIPDGNSLALQIIKTVFTKLRRTYEPPSTLDSDEAGKLKARFVFAIVSYINQVSKKTVTPIKTDAVARALQDNNGNILGLCSFLVEQQYLSLDGGIDEFKGLCKMILDALPKAEPVTSALASQSKSVQIDPIHNAKVWPIQEKREAPPYRACTLKGVTGFKDINSIQALVWGGRLESIALPASGSGVAVVKFLTSEGCEKYFKATENGIEVKGDKNLVLFVEKQAGPSSINDVIRHCAEGDASRCVRATDAEDDWSDALLTTLARGKGTTKRELDCIKRGKTAQGRFYIEFRFANIYHALNFKRELSGDPDWEHCVISHATDPCEVADGVHYENEEGSTILHKV